jgi:hypothetical protein
MGKTFKPIKPQEQSSQASQEVKKPFKKLGDLVGASNTFAENPPTEDMLRRRQESLGQQRQIQPYRVGGPVKPPSERVGGGGFGSFLRQLRPVRRFEDGGVDLGGWTPEEVMQQEQELEDSINQYEKYGETFEPTPIPQGVVESGQMTQEEFDKSRGNDTQKKRSNFEIPEERPFNFSQGQKVGSFDVGQGVDMKSNAENLEARKKSIMGLLKGGM